MPSSVTYSMLWIIIGVMTLLYAVVLIDYFLHKTQIMAHGTCSRWATPLYSYMCMPLPVNSPPP